MTAASHFLAQHADALVAAGWPFIPIMPPEGPGTDVYAKARGKAPGYWSGVRWIMFTGWRNVGVPDAVRVLPWTRWPACGYGFLCGKPCDDGDHISAADIDVRHHAAALEIDALAVEMLGDGPYRIGAAPKRLRAYRTAGPLPKLKSAEFVMPGDRPGDKAHAVEVLGDGQQFVAAGIHPGTGRPYEWPEGDIVNLEPQDLPLITGELLTAFILKAEEILIKHGGQPRKKIKEMAQERTERKTADGSVAPLELRARKPEELKQAFAAIPNDNSDYDDWIAIGYALKGALGKDGWPLFRDWSAQSAKDDADETAKAWDGFRDIRSGAGTIYHIAKQFGWARPKTEKKAVAPQQTSLPPHWPGADCTKDEALAIMKEDSGEWFRVAGQGATAYGYMRVMQTWLHRRMDRWAERQNAAIEQQRQHWLSKGGVADEAALAADLARQIEAVKKRLSSMKQSATKKIKNRTYRKFGVWPSDVGNGVRRQITAPAGSGKTTMVGDRLADDKKLTCYATIWNVVPDHELAVQTTDDLLKLGVANTVIRGRSAWHPTKEDERMCGRWYTAKKMGDLDISVPANLCSTCPLQAECRENGYLSQQTDKPGVYVLAHAYIPIGCRLIPDPDMVIGDESHWQQLTKRIDFAPEHITDDFKFKSGIHDLLGQWNVVAKKLYAAVTVQDGRILAAVRGVLTDDDFVFAVEALKAAEAAAYPIINGRMQDTDILNELEQKKDELIRVRNLIKLVTALHKELPKKRDYCNSVIFNPNVKFQVLGKGGKSEVTITVRRVIVMSTVKPDIKDHVPVLLIDASADVKINRAIWGSHLKDRGTKVERNAHITQVVTRSFSRTQLIATEDKPGHKAAADQMFKELTEVTQRIKAQHGSVALISYNGYAENLADKAGLEIWEYDEDDNTTDVVLHFKKVRGSNRAKNCEAGIIIGRDEHLEEAEYAARAWHAMDDEPIFGIDASLWKDGYYKQTRRYRMRDGSVVTAAVSVHPDERVQLFLEQMREREIEQAIDRLRLIHNINLKYIYLMTSIVVDATIDKIVSWPEFRSDGTRFERAWRKKGMIFGSGTHQHHAYPELWESEEAATLALKRTEEDLTKLPGAVEVEFRVAGVAGRASSVLIDSRRYSDYQADLSKELGKQVNIVGKDADMDAALEWVVPAMKKAGGVSLPLKAAYLVEKNGAPFTSAATANRLILNALKILNSGSSSNMYSYYGMTLNLRIYKSASQKCPSKALVVAGKSREEIEASLSRQEGKPVKLVDQPPASETVSDIAAAAAAVLADLSARLAAAAPPTQATVDAVDDLSGRLEVARPLVASLELSLEDMGLRLELAAPAKVVTLSDDLPGFEPDRTEEPAPVTDNGGCSDEVPVEIVVPDYHLFLAAQSTRVRTAGGFYRRKTDEEIARDVAMLAYAEAYCEAKNNGTTLNFPKAEAA